MRVFVAGATGVIGQYLVPSLTAAGHEVTASTRSALKANQLKNQGATPVIVDGLDREAVLKAVTAAQPEVIIHQMTALTSMKSFRNFDKEFAVTNQLRTTGMDYLASCLGVKPPMRAPVWLGQLLGGKMIVEWMTQGRGASNEKAKRELGWTPKYPSWRDGFPVWVEEFKSGKAA